MVMDPLRPAFKLFGSFIHLDDDYDTTTPPSDRQLVFSMEEDLPLKKRHKLRLVFISHQQQVKEEDLPFKKRHNQRLVFKIKHTHTPSLPQTQPRNIHSVLLSMGVAQHHSPTHFFNRTLFASDVKKDLNRLTIPRNQLLTLFLTHQEEVLLQERDANGDLKKLEVAVIDPSLNTHVLTLSRWNYNKNNKSSYKASPSAHTTQQRGTAPPSWSYALTGGWMNLIHCNGLGEGDTIQLWSFRKTDTSLGFIIFKESKTPSAAASDITDENSVSDHGSSSRDKGTSATTSPQGWGLKRKRGSNTSLSTISTA